MKKFLCVFICLGLFLLLFFLPRLIPINKVSCKSQYGPCDGEISAKLSTLQGKKYFDAKNGATKILSESKYVSQFSARFNLPDKLTIDLIEKKPTTAFLDSSHKYFLVNQYGEIVDEVNETLLPVIILDQDTDWNLVKGGQINEDTKFAGKVMQKMYYVYSISQARMTKDYVVFDLSIGKSVIFPLSGDTDVLFGALQVILSRLQGENNYSIIDLRFKNPILK